MSPLPLEQPHAATAAVPHRRPPLLGRRAAAAALAIGALAAFPGCTDPTTQPARSIAGCYHLFTPAGFSGAEAFSALPGRVRLYEILGDSAQEAGRRIVRSHPDSTRSTFSWAWWEVARPDTLRVVFSTSSLTAHLLLRPYGVRYAGAMLTSTPRAAVPDTVAIAWMEPVGCE